MISIKHWVGVCELAARKEKKWGGVGWGVETAVDLLFLDWLCCRAKVCSLGYGLTDVNCNHGVWHAF